MKTFTCLSILLCFFLPTRAQITFAEAIGGPSTDQALSAEQTFDGGYIAVGWTKSYGAGDWDIYLVKTDLNGAIEWTKTYGGPGEEVDCFVHQCSDSGYIITARTNSFGVSAADVYLIKTNIDGAMQWTTSVGGSAWDEGHSVIQTSDGNLVHTGFTNSFGAGSSDIYLIKTDILGNTLWNKAYGGTSVDHGHLVAPALDGGYLVVGETMSYGAGNYDFLLTKTDTAGNIVWTHTYGGTGDDSGWGICATSDSCYILTGITNSFGEGGKDVLLIKVDISGNIIWSKTYGNVGDDEGFFVQQTNDGGYVVTGESMQVNSDSADVLLFKINANGIPLWTAAFGGAGDDGCQTVQTTQDHGFFLAGYTNSMGAGDWDFYLIKTDSAGRVNGCNLADPVIVMNTITLLTSMPSMQTSSGGITVNQQSQQSFGGSAVVCTVTGLPNNNIQNTFSLYPNPFDETATINIPDFSLEKEMFIHVFQPNGKKVFDQKINSKSMKMNFENLESGIYFYNINNNNVNVYSGKFIKTGDRK